MLGDTRKFKINVFLLCCFEFFFYAYLATYYSFMFIFFQSKGISTATIGVIFAVNAFITIFSQPFWGIISDKLQNIKMVLFICIISATVLYQVLPFCSSTFLIVFILALINFFFGPLNPLIDSWIIQKVSEEKNIGYGHVRLWGCIGFAAASYLLGINIVLSSINIIFPTFAVLAIITIAFCCTIENIKPVKHLSFKDLKISRLLKNYNFTSFLVFATLFTIPIVSGDVFFTQLLQSLGGNEKNLGLAFAVCALSEVPLFFLSTYLLNRFKPLYLILFASCLYILRQFLYLLAFQPIHLIFIQALQGICFGIFLSSALYFIDSMTPIELKATSQTIFGSFFYGITGIAGSYFGGVYIENLGLSHMYKACFVVAFVVLVLFIGSLRLKTLLTKRNQTVTIKDLI